MKNRGFQGFIPQGFVEFDKMTLGNDLPVCIKSKSKCVVPELKIYTQIRKIVHKFKKRHLVQIFRGILFPQKFLGEFSWQLYNFQEIWGFLRFQFPHCVCFP